MPLTPTTPTTSTILSHSQVTITEPQPIVILFGPPASGKTCSLVRLLRYINQPSSSYGWNPDPNFRPTVIDPTYETVCTALKHQVNNSNIPIATPNDFYLLAQIRNSNGGKILFQILEAPGELYFPADDIKAGAPFNPHDFSSAYANTIINARNRKIWCFIVEPNWEDASLRAAYVQRIAAMKMHMSPTDKVIVICNKCDKMPNLILGRGKPNTSQFQVEMGHLYPGLFDCFRNTHPITRHFRKFNCNFVAFSSGNFTEIFTPSANAYPATLLNTILSAVRGY